MIAYFFLVSCYFFVLIGHYFLIMVYNLYKLTFSIPSLNSPPTKQKEGKLKSFPLSHHFLSSHFSTPPRKRTLKVSSKPKFYTIRKTQNLCSTWSYNFYNSSAILNVLMRWDCKIVWSYDSDRNFDSHGWYHPIWRWNHQMWEQK